VGKFQRSCGIWGEEKVVGGWGGLRTQKTGPGGCLSVEGVGKKKKKRLREPGEDNPEWGIV